MSYIKHEYQNIFCRICFVFEDFPSTAREQAIENKGFSVALL